MKKKLEESRKNGKKLEEKGINKKKRRNRKKLEDTERY